MELRAGGASSSGSQGARESISQVIEHWTPAPGPASGSQRTVLIRGSVSGLNAIVDRAIAFHVSEPSGLAVLCAMLVS